MLVDDEQMIRDIALWPDLELLSARLTEGDTRNSSEASFLRA